MRKLPLILALAFGIGCLVLAIVLDRRHAADPQYDTRTITMTELPAGKQQGNGQIEQMTTEAGVTIRQALDQRVEGSRIVIGNLFMVAGGMRLCSGIDESSETRCGEPSLEVEGLLSPDTANGQEVSLFGNVSDFAITIDDTPQRSDTPELDAITP